MQIADGETDRQTARCKKLLPAGAVRIKWPADVDFDEAETYVWSILKPSSFNKDVHLGWRFSATELQRMAAANSVVAPTKAKAKGPRPRSNLT